MIADADERREPVILEPDSLQYDQATATVVLVGSECIVCKRKFFPPRRRCAACAEETLQAVRLSTHGRLESFTRLHRTPRDAWVAAPYIIGAVLLPEGLTLYTHLIDSRWEDVFIGMDVKLLPFVVEAPDGAPVMAYAFGPPGDDAGTRA